MLEFNAQTKDRFSRRIPYSNAGFFIEIKIRITSDGHFRMGVGGGYATGFYLGREENGFLELVIGNNGGILPVFLGKEFHRIRAEIDSGELKVYVDSNLIKTYTLNPINQNELLFILGEYAIDGLFDNNISEVESINLNGTIYNTDIISKKRIKSSGLEWSRLESDRADINEMLKANDNSVYFTAPTIQNV